jgi:Ser/Thr protein kinase RdoA (MazF antagonist)
MAAGSSEPPQLRSILTGLLGRVHAIDALPSGTAGMSYRVECDSGSYVAKIFLTESRVLLGPGDQYALLGPLAEAGIAPARAGCDEAAGLLVTRFVADAASVSSLELRSPDRIAAVADLLNRLHRLPFRVPRFAPVAYAERYVREIGGIEALSPDDRTRLAEVRAIAAGLEFDSACLCHNDLTADNVLLGPAPKLIDFDYAVVAPPCLDLASLVVMNGFTEHDTAVLLAAYGDSRQGPFSPPEFARVQRLVRLLAHFWALASPDAGADTVAQYRIQDV